MRASVGLLTLIVLLLRPDLPAKIESGFDPAKDGLAFPNDGTYASDGDCIGMSILAIDRFVRRQEGETLEPLGEPSSDRKRNALLGDPLDHEVAAIIQGLARDVKVESARLSDPKLIRAALLRIEKTGRPETLGLDARQGGHTVVLFGWKEGALQIYDPNYPRETVAWPFDPVKGLGKHPKGGFYNRIDRVAALSLETYAGVDVAKIRRDCAARVKEVASQFCAVTVRVTVEGGSARLAGNVSRGLERGDEGPTQPPRRVWLRLNGSLEKAADLAKDGSFSLEIGADSLREGENRIQVIAATERGSYAGFGTARPLVLENGKLREASPASPAKKRWF